MIYPQGGIYIIAYLQGYICIMACTMRTLASWHIPKRTFASWHYSQADIRIMACTKGTFTSWHPYEGHLHHGIPTRGHLHHCIPKRGICIKTSASRLNMCTGTIMDKPRTCTLAWDICIMKIASLKRDMCIIWTFRVCIIMKSICIENKNLDLHHILFVFIRKIDI